jgi:hypothetical protein
MISVIGACEQWAAKIAVDAIREVCPAGVPETGLGLLGDEEGPNQSRALPHGEVDYWRPLGARTKHIVIVRFSEDF